MSKGTPRYTVRIPDDLMRWLEAQIKSRNDHSPEEGWDLSKCIVTFLRRELKKMQRSRKGRKLPAMMDQA